MSARLRAAAARALDALEDGNEFYAAELLRDLIDRFDDSSRKVICPRCGLDCRWHGRLEDHLRNVHGITEAA